MKARPEKGVEFPEALYPCSDGGCADEQTFPASDLHWIPEWEGWYGEHCVDGRRRFEGKGEIEIGVSLKEWLKEVGADDAKLANYREQIGALLKERDAALAKVDQFAAARDEAVKDGVFWMERAVELAAATSDFINGYFGPVQKVYPMKERCKAAVEAVEKARAT